MQMRCTQLFPKISACLVVSNCVTCLSGMNEQTLCFFQVLMHSVELPNHQALLLCLPLHSVLPLNFFLCKDKKFYYGQLCSLLSLRFSKFLNPRTRITSMLVPDCLNYTHIIFQSLLFVFSPLLKNRYLASSSRSSWSSFGFKTF